MFEGGAPACKPPWGRHLSPASGPICVYAGWRQECSDKMGMRMNGSNLGRIATLALAALFVAPFAEIAEAQQAEPKEAVKAPAKKAPAKKAPAKKAKKKAAPLSK